jgi:hypothetical protein
MHTLRIPVEMGCAGAWQCLAPYCSCPHYWHPQATPVRCICWGLLLKCTVLLQDNACPHNAAVHTTDTLRQLQFDAYIADCCLNGLYCCVTMPGHKLQLPTLLTPSGNSSLMHTLRIAVEMGRAVAWQCLATNCSCPHYWHPQATPVRCICWGFLLKCTVLLHDNACPHNAAAHTTDTLRQLQFDVMVHP